MGILTSYASLSQMQNLKFKMQNDWRMIGYLMLTKMADHVHHYCHY